MNCQKIIQYVLGAAFLFFGLNGFLQFMPAPEFSGAAGAMLGGLFGSGYFFQMLAALQIASAIAFFTDRWVGAALVTMFAFTLNIVLFNLFLDMAGILFGLVLFILVVYEMKCKWDMFAPLFE